MKFGTDVYGRYVSHRPYREVQREDIEWYRFPSTWKRPAWLANLFIAPFVIGWWLSKLTGFRWEDD